MYVFDGYNVTIDCATVSGTPPITITWLHNGTLIDEDVSAITITDAKGGDVIVCRVDNNIGFDEENTTIIGNVNKTTYIYVYVHVQLLH